jgi:hypothetical protein
MSRKKILPPLTKRYTHRQALALDQLAQSFGLTLARTQDKAISIVVGTINNVGVDFELPGFRATICHLPIDRDEPGNAVQLERKKGKKP